MTDMQGATVAITGGTGSFGSIMAAHLLEQGVSTVHILSRDEAKQDEMRKRFSDSRLRFFLGDVRDRESVASAFVDTDFVFHAAALKQVPSCEFFPKQAVRTNVVGQRQRHRGGRARRGALGRVPQHRQGRLSGERDGHVEGADGEGGPGVRAQQPARRRPTVSVTRYGNVMYSRGSVIPLFVEQLRAGQPMTVTEPEDDALPDVARTSRSTSSSTRSRTRSRATCSCARRQRPRSTIWPWRSHQLLGVDDPEIKVIGTRHGEKLSRDAAQPRGAANARRPGRLLPGPARRTRPQLRAVRRGGRAGARRGRGLHSANTEQLDVAQTKSLLRQLPGGDASCWRPARLMRIRASRAPAASSAGTPRARSARHDPTTKSHL